MDPVTHITAGLLGGQALRDKFPGKGALWFCAAAAWIPDMDNLVGLFSPELYLMYHRGITHSFAGGLALAVILSLACRRRFSSISWRWLVVTAYGGILCHIFLDLITSYGTQILAPFTRARFTLQCVFIIDPLYTLSLVGILCLSLVWKFRSRKLAVMGLVWLAAYPLINLGIKETLHHYMEKRLRRESVPYSRIHVCPDVLTPFFWKVIIENPRTYRVTGLRLLDLEAPLLLESFQKADLQLMSALGKRAPIFKVYAWFAVYPIMDKKQTSQGIKITFGDLRFNTALKFVRARIKKRGPPFSLVALLNRQGELAQYQYIRPWHAGTMQHLE